MQAPADETKEQPMEAAMPAQKRKPSATEVSEAEVAAVQKTPAKLSDKKRRRSQTAEGAERGTPAKMRKTSEGEVGEKAKDEAKSNKKSKSAACRNE